jgi:hypothetical protein
MGTDESKLPKEFPLIKSYVKIMPTLQSNIEVLGCQLKAIIKYHEACARAAVKLSEDLKKCKE